MYLVEDFYSIQGEGRYAGVVSIFLRFGGCNLECRGFDVTEISPVSGKILTGCDSIRAVSRDFEYWWEYIDSSKVLIDIIENYLKNLSFKPHIIITGGEPLIFYKNRYFYEMISYLVDNSFFITIETNATIEIDFEKYPKYKEVTFALGVKLSNSKELEVKRLNHKAIANILKHSNKSFFKFVLDKNFIASKKAKLEIENITKNYKDTEIYCMPLGKDSSELSLHDKDVVEFCKEEGFIYNDRLHIRLWGNQIGV